MAVNRATNIGCHPLAQPRHGIKACSGGHREHRSHAKKCQEIEINVLGTLGAGGAKTQIDHLFEREWDRQRGPGREQQGNRRHYKLRLVGREER